MNILCGDFIKLPSWKYYLKVYAVEHYGVRASNDDVDTFLPFKTMDGKPIKYQHITAGVAQCLYSSR